MVIDIISYTDMQFAALSEEQLLEVRQAQLKKNRLQAALSEKLKKEQFRLLENGILLSTIWPYVQWKLNREYEVEVESIRDALLFYLRFGGKSSGGGSSSGNNNNNDNNQQGESAPYNVDYSLSETERFNVVKSYYESAYTNGAQRFAAFKADQVAARYLGELYAPLYDYFLESA